MRRERKASSLIGEILVLLLDVVILGAGALRAWRRPRREPETIVEMIGRKTPRWIKGMTLLGFGTILLFGVVVFGRYWQPPPPDQPIPFSHWVHVSTKQLNCFFCHPNAATSANAGLPPVRKCLLCHSVIASRFWPIARINEYSRRGQGIPWVRVYRVPDFVHFSHQPHIASGIDCGYCHGNVKKMDRIQTAERIDMNFCVTCHWRNNAPADCVTCHY